MNQPKAYGSFINRGENTFRTTAFIQFGESENSIGSALLLNPGSADFNKINPLLKDMLNTSTEVFGEIKPDPTMEQLIKLVQAIYPNTTIDGRLHIYNLFNLQDATAKSAIDKLETLVVNREYDIKDSMIPIDQLQSNPWILLGWSLQKDNKCKSLRTLKEMWRNLIIESKIPSFGKQDPMSKNYYHPNPRIPTKKPIILKELIDLYAKI